MRARQIMTHGVITVGPDTPIMEAAKLMLDKHISGLPVVKADGQLIGIVSEGDFLRRAEIGTQRKHSRWLQFFLGGGRAALDFVHEQGRKISEIMTDDPYTISEDTELEEIVRLMESKHVKRLPVVRENQVIGIVTRSNLLQAVANFARDMPATNPNDIAIGNNIVMAMEGKDWRPIGLNLSVRNGVVHLYGSITDDRCRQAAIVATENVAGVHEVHDHLCWIEPMSGMYMGSPEDEKQVSAPHGLRL
ncbi:CBS domain-containing protein [Methylocella sp. CPCC 101449]|uniref:CBS domain-containing protein n=1 Tax=Methylocella sp. CPCC 101449 TaxID=2987531 RepID=UPI00288E51F1|nr:CBS domain-containing protein [Methylocella sp. CPCC 101449]MDT2022389.1 CBS domain-containing protein [Methylocella sp. CPCC 101449]